MNFENRTVDRSRPMMLSAFQDRYEEAGYALREPGPEFLALVEQLAARALEWARLDHDMERMWTHVSGKVKHLSNVHRSEPLIRQMLQSRDIQECIAALFGETPVYVTHSKMSYKNANIQQVWLPHQDSAYKIGKVWGSSICVFLEDCDTDNGTLELFPGSHREGRRKHEIVFHPMEKEPQMRVAAVPDIRPVPIIARKGTILCMHCDMLHQSGENRRGGIRPIYIFEVEPTRRFPLEDDGRDAIVLNRGCAVLPKPPVLWFRRRWRWTMKHFVKPVFKKLLLIRWLGKASA